MIVINAESVRGVALEQSRETRNADRITKMAAKMIPTIHASRRYAFALIAEFWPEASFPATVAEGLIEET